jgi:hypothetical protein
MADRYWVGGSGTWDTTNTTNWSASPGGAGGASVPAATDNVFFEAASASGNYTVSITDGSTCANISVARATAGTLGVSGGALLISGSWTSVATGVTWSASITFNATSGSYTVTTGGLSLGAVVQFNGAGGTWQLQDNLTTASTFALWGGTLDINGRTVTCNFATVSSATTRVLALGTGGTIVCPNTTGGFVWNGQDATGFSYTGTGSVNFTYSGGVGTRTIQHGSTAGGSEATKAPPFNISAGTDSVQAIGHFSDLSTVGFSGTFNGGIRVIYGNLTIGSGTTVQASASTTTFAGSSGTKTITTNGRTMAFPITINGFGSIFQLADNYTSGSTATQGVLTLTGGTLDLNGKTLTAYTYVSSGSSIRGITGNGGQINITSNSTTSWGGSIITNVTYNALVVNFTYNGSTGTRIISLGSLTEANSIRVNITAGTDIVSITGASGDLNFTGFSGTLAASTRTVRGNLTYSPTMTVTASTGVTTTLGATSGTKTITTNGINVFNSFTINGAGGTFQLANNFNMGNSSTGTLFTLTAGTLDLNDKTLTTGTFNTTGSGVRSIGFGTLGVINITFTNTTVWNGSLATNFTYTGQGNIILSTNSSVGTRNITHGVIGSFPTNLPPTFNIIAGTDNIGLPGGGNYNSINFTGFSGNLLNSIRTFYGNVTLSPTMNLIAGANVTTFNGTSTQYYESAGLLNNFSITIGNGTSTGTVVLANTLTVGNTRALTLTSGNLLANGFDITTGTFSSSGANLRILDISNVTLDLDGTGIVWDSNNSTNLTLNSANSTILISDNTSGNKILNLGNAVTYDNVVIGGDTSSGTTTFVPSGNITIDTLSSTRTVNQTIVINEFPDAYTTINNYNVVGTANATVTLSSSGASPFNLIYGGTGNVNVDYHTISNSNASPSNTWYALLTNNNVNGGNNTGWIFSTGPGPTNSGNFLLLF